MNPQNDRRRTGDDDEGSVSTWTRWALFAHDHPGATYEARMVDGNPDGVPDVFNPPGQWCEVTIHIPGMPDRVARRPVKVTAWDWTAEPKVARRTGKRGDWVDVPSEQWTAEDWNGNRTATLGRALRDAGYPNTLAELQLVRRWIGRAVTPAEPPVSTGATRTGPPVAPQTAASGSQPISGVGSHTNPPAAPANGATGDDDMIAEARSAVRDALDGLTGPQKAEASKAMREAGIPNPIRPATIADCDTALGIIRGLTETAEPEPGDEEPF